MGVMLLVSEGLGWRRFSVTTTLDFGVPYLSISVSLNVLLTIMIVIRLILHSRNILATRGAAGRIGLYRAIITMLIESSALYAVNSLLLIGLLGAGNHAADTFLPILAETQVRAFLKLGSWTGTQYDDGFGQVVAPLLIIQRVANQNALSGTAAVVRQVSSPNPASRGKSTGGSRTPPGQYPMGPVDKYRTGVGRFGGGVESPTDFYRYKV